MAEREEAGSWAGWSPYCLQSALPPENSPDDSVKLRLRWVRIYWWVFLLLAYSALLLQSNANRQLSSGVRYEIIEQLFPDWNKAAERTRDAEISPSLKELLQASDVASTLSFYNDICASQSSISAALKDTWECKLFDISVGGLEGEDWDATANRALPDRDKDAVMNGKRGILEAVAKDNRTNKVLAKQRQQEIRQICSPSFFQSHFIIGDDPRKVPLGDVKAFAEKIREVHPGLDSVFDPYPLHERGFGGMKRMLKEIKQEVKQLKDFKEPELPGNLHAKGRLSTRQQKRWGSALLTDSDATTQEAGAAAAASAAPNVSNGSEVQGNQSNITNSTGLQDETFPSGCFDPGDVAGLLRDLWVSHAANADELETLHESNAKGLIKEVFPNMTSNEWPEIWKEMNPDGDFNITGEEFLVYAEKHLKDFQWPIRGYLNSECRNHHFGLISLCKPKSISAHYQVALVSANKSSDGEYLVQQRINIQLFFNEVTPRSGWYKASLRIFNKSCVGSKTTVTVVLMVLTLLLFSVLTLIDSLATLLLLPVNLYRILWIDLPSDADFQEIQRRFWLKLLQVLDARGVASRFLPTLILLAERLLAFAFLMACIIAALEALENSMLPFGILSERCMLMWFRGNKDWIIGKSLPRGVDMVTYINKCTDVRGVQYVAEILFELLFEDEGCFHALVVGLIMIRILEAFSLSSRLNWLPRTLFLAKNKLQNFLIAYVCLVAGASLIMTLYFGDIFQQFSSLQESFCTLLLYSFGNTERAYYGSEPFIELGSTHLHAALFFYTVFVVTIILNMFTTIVIDAFTAEGDPEKYEKIYAEEMTFLTTRLLQVFGKGHLVSRERISSEASTAKTDTG